MVQSAEEIRLKAIIKRRDTRIAELKAIKEEAVKQEYNLRQELNELLRQRQDFKTTLIEFLNLDQHIRNVVKDSL